MVDQGLSAGAGAGLAEGEPVKTRYRVRNWREYDRALVQRGSLTVWFDEEFLRDNWKPAASGKCGAPWQYSDTAIQTLLTIKQVFHLTFRSLEGFAGSLMTLMGSKHKVPDHTHMSRRGKTLSVVIPRQKQGAEPVHLVVDSTGLKVYGEGEWKVRLHGAGKRRTWRKIHLGVDADTKGVLSVEVTTADWTDAEVLPSLLEQIDSPVAQVGADGAYDTKDCYDAIAEKEAIAAIPPRTNAVLWGDDHPRDAVLSQIEKEGMAAWKVSANYHRRSLAENAMYRLKQLFGDKLSARCLDTQTAEVHCRIAAMNIMTTLGMPVSAPHGKGASKIGAAA